MADKNNQQSLIVEQAFPVDTFNCSVKPINEEENDKDEEENK